MPADTRYNPPNMTRRLEIQYLSLVIKADPDFNRQRLRTTYYEFSNGRIFKGDENNTGARAED
jgi:hypothetical protein